MNKMLIMSASILGLMSMAATAGQPENPGQHGRDRAAAIKTFQESDVAPGASEWGHMAAERGSTNGDLNRAYRDEVGGSPTHGNDADQDDGDDNMN